MPLLSTSFPFVDSFDSNILFYIQDHIRCRFLDWIFPNITFLGDGGVFWILLAAVFMCFRKTRRAAFCAAFALIGSLLLNNFILKPLVDRIRPYEYYEGLILIGKRAFDASFPSGHTAASVAAAVAMSFYLKKRQSIPLIFLALMIGFSRLYIAIHYPTDVLFGLFDGVVLAFVALVLERWIHRKYDWYRAFVDEKPDATAEEGSAVKADGSVSEEAAEKGSGNA